MTDPATLIRTHLEEPVSRIEPVRDGNRKETYRGTLASGRTVYVQLGGPALRDEIALHRDLSTRDVVPVPAVLASGPTDGRMFFITAAVHGERLTDVIGELANADRRTLARTLGRHLGRLHEAYEFDGHGSLREREGRLVVDPSVPARTFVWDLLDRGLAAFPRGMADLRRAVDRTLDRRMIPSSVPATLYAWDFRPGNMRWHDGDVVGVLDWGSPIAGPAAVGVAKAMYVTLDWFELTAFRPAFVAGYRSIRRFSVDPSFWQVASILAVVRSAVDSRGTVTRPFHPVADEPTARAFHRNHLERLLAEQRCSVP